MEKITAAELIRGSKRLDEMWSEVRLVVRMVSDFLAYEFFLGEFKLKEVLKIEGHTTFWTLSVENGEVVVWVYTSDSSTMMTCSNPQRPHSESLVRIHQGLDRLIRALEERAPQIRRYFSGVLAAAETVEK